MLENLTVLHVSDLQFGRNHRFGCLGYGETDLSFDTLFERLRLDLELLAKDGIHPQLVVVSGDIAELGKKEEFADGSEFLKKLSEYLKVPRQQVIVVPG